MAAELKLEIWPWGRVPALEAAEQALSNPLLGTTGVKSAKGMLVNITGGKDMTLFEVDEAAQKLIEQVEDENANIIFGSAYDHSLEGSIRVSVVAPSVFGICVLRIVPHESRDVES